MMFAKNSKAKWRKNDRDIEGAVLFSRNNKKAPSDFFPPYALKLGSQATSTMTLETKKRPNNKFLKLFFFISTRLVKNFLSISSLGTLTVSSFLDGNSLRIKYFS